MDSSFAFHQGVDPSHRWATGRTCGPASALTQGGQAGARYFFFTKRLPENASASITPSPLP